MILNLPGTTTRAIGRKLIELRDEGGAIALGRVLTLIIVTTESDAEEAIDAANDASREHPCRVLVLATGDRDGEGSLDAQIRLGGDAGASEVVVLTMHGELIEHAETVVTPLLLPDAPIVAWWPQESPDDPSADPIGRMAHRRVTNAGVCADPLASLDKRRTNYRAGDTDLAWTSITLWRTILASALDQPPHEAVTGVVVGGQENSAGAELLAAWLSLVLEVPVTRRVDPEAHGVTHVHFDRPSGGITVDRPHGDVAILTQPDQPDRRISLPHRVLRDCLSEELRRLDPDEVYGEVLLRGLPLLATTGKA